jgi:hypothetical protein
VEGSHNLLHSAVETFDPGGYPADLVNDDPRFVDASVGDYRPRPESPSVDAGTAVPVERDLEGNPRPLGSGYDTGPYER